jgi:predicted ATPase
MLRRVRIQNYKSLVDVDVTLNPLVVIFGPNAAGKSNFLDALQLLSRLATSRTLKDAFDPPCRGTPLESFTFGPTGIEGLLREDSKSFTIEADVELSPPVIEAVDQQIREMRRTKSPDESGKNSPEPNGISFVRETYLRYRVEVEILPKSGILRVADEYLTALTARGDPTGKRKAFLECVPKKEGGESRLHLRMEGQAHPTYHERYLDHTILSLPLYPPHYPHLVAVRRELASWFFYYFEPRERMRAPTPVKAVRHIGLMGEELASFLNTLQALDIEQFKAVERSLRMIIPGVTGIRVGPNRVGEVELGLLEGETPMPAGVLSEGTLRTLGLLALSGVKEPPALVGFEEPENGIHPRRIRLIAELLTTRAWIGDTQLIVTTHSPILPDLISNDSLFVCRKVQGCTLIEPFTSWGPLAEMTRSADIVQAMDAEERPTVSERIVRGDFDA